MSGYQSLASFYDRLMADVDYDAKAAYMLALFARFGQAHPACVLDLACGSGNLTAPLVAAGLDVIGVDLSEDMLVEAKQKLPDTLFLQQDMRQLALAGTVSGVVCGMDGINHLCRTADVAAVFAGVYRALEKGGLFVFDVNTPYKHREVLADHAFVFEEEDFLCVWQNRLIARTMEVDMWLDFFVEGADGRYDRLCDHVRERAYSEKTLRRLLAEAGFDVLAVYEDMTENAPADDSQRMVFVARR